MKLELKKFDPNSIKDDSTIVLIGKRNTGKSFCMKDILSHHKNIPIGMTISPTEIANKYFEKFIPKMLIHESYTQEIIQKFMDRQVKICKKVNKEKERTGYSSIDPRAFLILDDCLYDNSWTKDINIKSCFMNGRHYKIFFLITMQFPLGIPPHLRANIDYIFIFRDNMIRNKQKIYEHYAGMFPNFDVFRTVMDSCTENYECLVINNKVQSNKIEDQVFWYKANESDFKMCRDDLWDLQAIQDQKLAIADDEEEYEEQYDPNLLIKQKTKITVKKKDCY
jgi:hypothetical protein